MAGWRGGEAGGGVGPEQGAGVSSWVQPELLQGFPAEERGLMHPLKRASEPTACRRSPTFSRFLQIKTGGTQPGPPASALSVAAVTRRAGLSGGSRDRVRLELDTFTLWPFTEKARPPCFGRTA